MRPQSASRSATTVSSDDLRTELIAMAEEDQRVREELAADGLLYRGYHPRMQAVHDQNASRLQQILDEHGWPNRSMVGEQAAEAAWLVVQHAIGHPDLQRRCLLLLKQAAATGESSPVQAALLEDRIRAFGVRRQLYGTQFDWDDNGQMSPLPIEDPDHVDERRRELGLPPLAETTAQHRAAIAKNNASPPEDRVAAQREQDEWARTVGWR